MVRIGNVGRLLQQVARGTRLAVPMDTPFLLVIMSIVALHLAALLGGGLALGVMRLLGRAPTSIDGAEGRESIH
jgi:hypothetical protein